MPSSTRTILLADYSPDPSQYIQIAVRLAVDIDWRYSVREALKLSINVLFDNPTATQNLEVFIKQAIALKN